MSGTTRGAALLPCPFCGAEPRVEDHRTIFAVVCDCDLGHQCVTVLGDRSPEPNGTEPGEHWNALRQTAIDRWNRRALPTGADVLDGERGAARMRVSSVYDVLAMLFRHEVGIALVAEDMERRLNGRFTEGRLVEQAAARDARAPSAPVGLGEAIETARACGYEVVSQELWSDVKRQVEELRALRASPVGTESVEALERAIDAIVFRARKIADAPNYHEAGDLFELLETDARALRESLRAALSGIRGNG